MKLESIKQILFLTRPWQVDFHVELAKSLTSRIGKVPVKFVTFFSWAKERAEASGYECVYMPEELRKVTGGEITNERFSEIDRFLYETQGANFNLMLQSERFLPKDGKEAELFGRKHLVVLDRLVTEGTLSISSMYDHFFYWLAGALANSRKGAHFAFVGCGLPPGRVLALRTPWETWHVPFEGDAQALLEECRKLLHTPVEKRIEYMKPQMIPPLYKRLRNRIHQSRCYKRDRLAGSYFPNHEILSLQTITKRLPNKLSNYPEPEYDIKNDLSLGTIMAPICYIPLHMEPEATILMYSPWLRDQIEMCRLVSQALPVGWKLLVKENPKMRGKRPLDYYQKLKAIPNLVLVSSLVDSTSLISAARITVTLAGTSLNEAVISGKPAIALGCPPSLGFLTLCDISGDLKLRELFEKVQKQDFILDVDAWRAWISGSFEAHEVPVFSSDSIYAIPHDIDNVSAYRNYIWGALKFVNPTILGENS